MSTPYNYTTTTPEVQLFWRLVICAGVCDYDVLGQLGIKIIISESLGYCVV